MPTSLSGVGQALTAHSCGGSRGFAPAAAGTHHIPLTLAPEQPAIFAGGPGPMSAEIAERNFSQWTSPSV